MDCPLAESLFTLFHPRQETQDDLSVSSFLLNMCEDEEGLGVTFLAQVKGHTPKGQ